MESYQFRAMNTDIVLAAEGSLEQIRFGIEKSTQYIHESERRFTRFSNDSELSQLNNMNGAWFHASSELFEVVQLAKSFFEQTHGLFDPSILPDLNRIGYDRSMDLIRANGVNGLPTPSSRLDFTFDEILFNPEELLISLPVGLTLDLGGIAKGWIAEQAAHILSDYASACGVSAGGDMFLIGLPNSQTGWPVSLEDPRNPGEDLALLNIPPGGVATSSVSKRIWKQGDKVRHHLIDPRTHEPAETKWLSVTVIATETSLCEAFAKALLIAGPNEAPEIAKNADIDYLAIDQNGNILGTNKSLEYLYEY